VKINKKRVACFSDFHLGIHQASFAWHKISLDFVKWLKQELLAQNIKDIIIPGDILDDRDTVSVTTLHFLPQFFKILDCFNIIISVGNHDCYYNRRSDIHSLGVLNDWENITIIDKITTITAHNRIITFCPWHINLDDVPKSDILFGHFDIQTFKMNGFKINENGIKSKQLLEKGDLIITGHYHLTQERVYQNGKILYLGSPYELNWGEANSPKGFYILDIDKMSYEFIINDKTPKHIKIKLSDLFEEGAITDRIKKMFKGNIVKFIVDIETRQTAIDDLIAKFYLLKPLELKIVYEYVQKFKAEDMLFESLGVNVQTDLTEFVQNLDFVEQKDDIIKYLNDIYSRAERVIK